MGIRRLATVAGATAILVAACGGGSATTAPSAASSAPSAEASASAGASESAGASASSSAAAGGDCTVGVSWNNFQQPRWAAFDKPGIQSTVEAAGGKYIDADANLSNEQQATDIDSLISQG